MPQQIPNISWLFYKDYYANLQSTMKAANEGKDISKLPLGLDAKNQRIIAQSLSQHPSSLMASPIANSRFQLTTRYPGMVAGLGTQHSIGHEDEIKLGFSFDHTTGLPYLPSSSVKGLLRSVFPSRLTEAANSATSESEKQALSKKADGFQKWLTALLKLEEKNIPESQYASFLKKLEDRIFAGKHSATEADHIYNRDIFFDAYPIRSQFQGTKPSDKDRFLGLGALTPHGKNPLKNPTPLRLLKVLPKVTFQFQFYLHASTINDTTITQLDKINLFKEIIENLGMGAKTNVGYGSGKSSNLTIEN